MLVLGFEARNFVLLCTTPPSLVDIKDDVERLYALTLLMKEKLEQENMKKNIGFCHK